MMDKKTQKIGVICSIVQIILSIICLIYSAINQENIPTSAFLQKSQ